MHKLKVSDFGLKFHKISAEDKQAKRERKEQKKKEKRELREQKRQAKLERKNQAKKEGKSASNSLHWKGYSVATVVNLNDSHLHVLMQFYHI